MKQKQRNSREQLNIFVNDVKNNMNENSRVKQSKNNYEQNQLNLQSSIGGTVNPNKRDELKRVQEQIQTMKNKVLLLRQQLKKEQDSIKSNKSKTQQIIKKKINVNKIQRYKYKDNSIQIERAEQLRLRNASLRQAHQSQMQNIFKAIYLVKLDDARHIKDQSKSLRIKIKQMNDSIWSQQIERKKKITQESQKAKQKYEKYWREKLASLYENQTKNKEEIEKLVSNKKDELKQLRQEQIKLLQNMNKLQSKQLQSKKQYLAALSLPVKDVAEALNMNKSNKSVEKSENDNSVEKMNRMNSDLIAVRNSKSSLSYNLSGLQSIKDSLTRNYSVNEPQKHHKLPNSTVNKDKLKVILKQLKRLQRIQKSKSGLQ